jgi:hypothetical protein
MPLFWDADWVSFLFHMLSNSRMDALAPPSFWLPQRGIVVLSRIAVSQFTPFYSYVL